MKLPNKRARVTALVFIAVTAMLSTACSHVSAGVGVSYQPPVPLQFSVSFNISANGNISLGGSVGVVTPGGIFSLQADIETNLQPAADETLLIIRHHQGQGVVDSVYHIGTSEEVIVTLNGHVIIDVSNHKIVINAVQSKVQSIEVTNAAVPTPPAPPSAPPAPGTVQLLSTVQSSETCIENVSWSPDGTMFVDAGSNEVGGNFVSEIRRAPDGALVSSLQVPDGTLYAVSWSPNGQYIAGSIDSDLDIWSASTGNLVNEISGPWPNTISWSPDSQYVVTSANAPDQPTVWSVASGSQISSYTPTDNLIDGANWSPTGDLIVSDNTIWNGMTGQVVRTYVGGDQNGFPISFWSPNGQEIASIDGDGDIVAWDPATGATIWQSQAFSDEEAVSLSWSPNGKYIAWIGDSGAGILDASTGNPVASFGSNVISASVGMAPSITWSPNGRYITTTDGSCPLQIWQAPNWSN